MTRTKLWRLSLAAILGFGWLFLTPAYSDDPLSIAAQEIQKLNDSVTNLNYRTDFESLISVAESKYDDAVNARDAKNEASSIYDAALSAKSIALNEKLFAQTAVEGQTAIVANAQNNLDIASINLSTAQIQYPVQGTPGLNAYLYDCWTSWNLYNNAPQFGCGTTPTSMGPWTSMWWNFGGGGPAGLYDDYQIHLVGYIKQTQHWTPQFRTCGDDGMVIIINGVTVASDWYDRGGGCGISNGYYMPNNDWVPIEIWWYENGGGANGEAQWNIGNGFVTIPSNVLSTEIPFVAPELITAQEDYNNKLSIYNQEVQTLQALQSNLTLANQNLTLADQNLTSAQTEKDNSVLAYDQSIVDLNNSINVAWNYYEEQLAREIAIALAQAAAAAANQPTPEPSPQPTEESTPEPSPEPSPEQTKPIDPTPEPSSDTTDEPKPEPSSDPEPTPEPSQEPSPQPTDIDPETTPEPEPIPTEPSEESQDNVIIKDEELLELIPEKGTGTSEDLSGVIANLTSKDNKLVKLTAEQVAAVSQTLNALTSEAKQEVAQDLGIKSSEVSVIAEAMKNNPELAAAFVQFKDREASAENATMPYTLADATTEVQTEAFLADPIGAILDIDFEKVLDPSEWGKDMTDDQREKAQEVVVPVIIAGNIVAAAMTRRI